MRYPALSHFLTAGHQVTALVTALRPSSGLGLCKQYLSRMMTSTHGKPSSPAGLHGLQYEVETAPPYVKHRLVLHY